MAEESRVRGRPLRDPAAQNDIDGIGEDGSMTEDHTLSELDQSLFTFETLAEDPPSRLVTVFHDLLHSEERPVELLSRLVTPEMRDDWGDFSDASQFIVDQSIAISAPALRHKGAEDVAYVKLVPDDGVYLAEVPKDDVLAYVTLVWRPEKGGWLIHCIGQPVPPPALPRTENDGAAPRYDTDVEVEVIPD